MAKTSFQGSNLIQVKDHNLRAVLRLLLTEKGISRIELARKTGLSATTISNLIDELVDNRIVVENPDGHLPEQRRVGRRSTSLQLNPTARYAIGVHIRVGMIRVALVDLLGHVVESRTYELATDEPARQAMERIASSVDEIISQQGIERSAILGVGVGASGLVNFSRGINLQASNFGWRDVPMRDWLIDLLKVPVVVDNNVRCMALAEALFGAGKGVNSLAFVYGRFGVGSGIVVNGKVFRGNDQGAGEIGHTIVLPHNGPLCRCGQRGCLETLISESALTRQATNAANLHPGSILEQCMNSQETSRPVKRLFTAYRMGDPWAKELIETSAEYLGIALTNLVNLINPEIIFLGGLFEEEKDTFLPIVRKVMVSTSFAGIGEHVRLEATSFSWKVGMIGAAALALSNFFYLDPTDV